MKSRLELKVGLFVLIGLVLLAALMLQFSKGTSWLRPTYMIRLQSTDVAGLKLRAAVLMSGVQVGSVSDIQLAEDGRSVTIWLKIYNRYKIHKDARFLIEQSGFLGDQYISIQPTENKGEVFQDQDVAKAEPPFSISEMARAAGGLAGTIDEAVRNLNQGIADLRRLLLNEQTLTNLSATALNARRLSERGVVTVDNVNGLIDANKEAIGLSLSNLVLFSENINRTADDLNDAVATNGVQLSAAMDNLQITSAKLKGLIEEVEAGRGLAGTLVKDQKIANDLSQITGNLSITTSNLNRLGLWGILWQKKTPRQEGTRQAETVRSPKESGRF
jgi:phospholipid/cholesterol/gamma-HCH transport system substrate-binding protein